jgi:hypothetical protein
VLRQNAAAKRFDFTEGDRLETTRALQSEAEAAYAAEKVENAQFAHQPTPCFPGAFGVSGRFSSGHAKEGRDHRRERTTAPQFSGAGRGEDGDGVLVANADGDEVSPAQR